MNIVGQQKTSLIDYPDKICTVYFFGGCNFACPYCHNSHLLSESQDRIPLEEILSFLKKRKRFIDAVCLSGGEATLYEDLGVLIQTIKAETGLLVKLDTNGTRPEQIRPLFEQGMLDYVAMDVKGPLWKYDQVTGVPVKMEDIEESIRLIRDSGIDYEFRTTVCKELLRPEDILEVALMLKGSARYALQNFKDGPNVLAGEKRLRRYSEEELKQIGDKIRGYFGSFKIRS